MEEIPQRTYEVQAGYLLGLLPLQDWVNWAMEAIVAGYDSKSLRLLSGLEAPFDDQEINRLSNKTFAELNIVPLKKENYIPYYIAPILHQKSEGTLTRKEALAKLKDLCLVTNYQKPLMDFYLLYFALSDLETSEVQWYWKGANRENIAKIVDDYFENWLKNHHQNALV
jgi:hypothetical protein